MTSPIKWQLMATKENLVCPLFLMSDWDNQQKKKMTLIPEGKLTFAASFLRKVDNQSDDSTDSDYNPVTQAAIHLALFGWFHEGNCKKTIETRGNHHFYQK